MVILPVKNNIPRKALHPHLLLQPIARPFAIRRSFTDSYPRYSVVAFASGCGRRLPGFRPSRLSFSPDFSCRHHASRHSDLPQAALFTGAHVPAGVSVCVSLAALSSFRKNDFRINNTFTLFVAVVTPYRLKLMRSCPNG
ncbi:hypothetical protein KCP69_08840 [Salmonella enterica subsp. enterica]|nr:hypothetical protein KCP69_08840 [Salmonella enterica subsp. enterica]